MTKKVNKIYKVDINSMDIDIPLAIFGAIYEGDPIGELRDKTPLIEQTQYPPLVQVAHHFGIPVQLVYDTLIRDGRVIFMCAGEIVIATHAYTHDNNTSRRLQ